MEVETADVRVFQDSLPRGLPSSKDAKEEPMPCLNWWQDGQALGVQIWLLQPLLEVMDALLQKKIKSIDSRWSVNKGKRGNLKLFGMKPHTQVLLIYHKLFQDEFTSGHQYHNWNFTNFRYSQILITCSIAASKILNMWVTIININ